MLEINCANNTWNPPAICETAIISGVLNENYISDHLECLYIFRTEPYIDSIYIEYYADKKSARTHRFTIHEGYRWDTVSENIFHDKCVKNSGCKYDGGQINKIYDRCASEHPEWHVKRYYTNGLRLLDHVYNCVKENTAKEILYKSGLDELAAHIDEMDEINLLASKPSDLYNGLSMKALRSVNCEDGARLVKDHDTRLFLKELNLKFPETFTERLNDAQCRYLSFLIKGDLFVGEVGRLFASRRRNLSRMWCRSQFDMFLFGEKLEQEILERRDLYAKLDPIYADYIRSLPEQSCSDQLKQLDFYLRQNREKYDAAIRRSNRKREYSWQERGEKYYVRYPQTINDFCREAIYMRNCLISYVEAMINNDTTILFMRKADEPNKPYITIEIYQGKLMQAYHRFNKDCSEDEAEWIRKYCFRHRISTGSFKFNNEEDELF